MTGAAAAIAYGLCSALSWGTGDFIGGYASRRLDPLRVILVSQLAGLVMLLAAALITGETFPAARDLGFGALGGLAGVVGLIALYRGLAEHKMGTIAPLSALLTALLPIAAALLLEGPPAPVQFAGILVAGPAIYWIARDGGQAGSSSGAGLSLSWSVARYPLVAGLGFGLFFIMLDRVTTGAVFWPIVAVRVASISAVLAWLAAAAARRRSSIAHPIGRSDAGIGRHRAVLPALILLGGVFDAGGNVFFALAAQAGRLDIAAVLASLYPAGTVFLARIFLKERLAGTQRLGVAAALVSVILFSF